jgi:hypothetical protein
VNIGGQRTRHEFVKPVVWLQESEATLQYLHGGQVLKVASGTYNDFYGYLTAVQGVQTDFSETAGHLSITTTSSLELVIKATMFLRPAIETPETIKHNREKPANFKSQWCYVPDEWRKEVVTDGEKSWPHVERADLDQAVVWSSKNTQHQNTAVLATFMSKWRQPELERNDATFQQ